MDLVLHEWCVVALPKYTLFGDTVNFVARMGDQEALTNTEH